MNKRLLKEVRNLVLQQSQKDILENDYLVHMPETNANEVYALIKAPQDSVYRHKFIKLQIKIPENYPHSPPEVFFVNHDGTRIHPNMYENGKCCSTILNTWGDNKFEKWTSSMGIETILITFHSFLDNNPYTYEPGGHDDLSYTVYVQHQSWYTCLIRYLHTETIPLFTQMMYNYMLVNIDSIFQDLYELNTTYPANYYHTRCFEIDSYPINYEKIIHILHNMYNYIDYKDNVMTDDSEIDWNEFVNKEYNCHICFDTNSSNDSLLTTECKHSFHVSCLKYHVENNNAICPMCRQVLCENDLNVTSASTSASTDWVLNPLTKRRVKVGSKTWKYLVENGVIQDS